MNYLPSFNQSGALSLVTGLSMGSEAKGRTAYEIAMQSPADIYVSVASTSGAHTLPDGRVAYHLPVGALVPQNKRSTIYLAQGSVIDPERFKQEIEDHDVNPDRIVIAPTAAVVVECDKMQEVNELTRIASTVHGGGAAFARKVMRDPAAIAQNHPYLSQFCHPHFSLSRLLDEGMSAMAEVPQGYGLSLNNAEFYPYVTSKDINVSAALAACGLHPRYLGNVCGVARRFIIRVGNPTDENGVEIGYSGPFPSDSELLNFEKDLKVPVERTTLTDRPRFVGTLSRKLYLQAMDEIQPDVLYVTFCDYPEGASFSGWNGALAHTLPLLVDGVKRPPSHVVLTFGPGLYESTTLLWQEVVDAVNGHRHLEETWGVNT